MNYYMLNVISILNAVIYEKVFEVGNHVDLLLEEVNANIN